MSTRRNDTHRSKLSRSFSDQQTQHCLHKNRTLTPYRREQTEHEHHRHIGAQSSFNEHYCCHQLAERIRELENEIIADAHSYPISTIYSPFSPVTPSSNMSTGTFSLVPYPTSFAINLPSPHANMPCQRLALSSKVLSRAHQIPERFVSCVIVRSP
jgi:hypothetical protein